MKKTIIIFLGMLLITACSWNKDSQKIQVVTSFYPLYDFASKVGEGSVEVHNLVGSGQDAHAYEPSPKDMARLQEADVFIYHGAGFESWTDKVVASLKNTKVKVVEVSAGLELLAADREGDDHDHHETEADHDHEGENADHDHHESEANHEHHPHTHGKYDPHTWLNPLNASQEMEAIANALISVDPNQSALYGKNLDKYKKEFTKLDETFRNILTKKSEKEFLVDHQAYGYLAKAYGLQQEGIVQSLLSIEPTQKELETSINYIEEHNIKTIFMAPTRSTKVMDVIAKETGVKIYPLHTLENLSKSELDKGLDYFELMRQNLKSLEEGLQ